MSTFPSSVVSSTPRQVWECHLCGTKRSTPGEAHVPNLKRRVFAFKESVIEVQWLTSMSGNGVSA